MPSFSFKAISLATKLAPAVIVGVIITLGTIFIALGYFFGTPPITPSTSDQKIFDVLGTIGELILVGGVFAGILKFLQFAHYFREALADIVVRDEFISIRNDLPDLWYRLTQRIYLRGFGMSGGEDAHFAARGRSGIEQYLRYDEEFFLRNVRRSLLITWADAEETTIQANEEIEFEIVPFSSGPVTYRSIFTPTSGMRIDDYHRDSQEIWIDGEKKDPKINHDDGSEHLSVPLKDKAAYHIRRLIKRRWVVDRDPFCHYTSPYVIDGSAYRVQCEARGLNTIFVEIGMEGRYEDRLSSEVRSLRIGDQDRECRKVILPGQGHMIIFQRYAMAEVGTENPNRRRNAGPSPA